MRRAGWSPHAVSSSPQQSRKGTACSRPYWPWGGLKVAGGLAAFPLAAQQPSQGVAEQGHDEGLFVGFPPLQHAGLEQATMGVQVY